MKNLRAAAALVLIAGLCLSGRAVYVRAKAGLAGALIRVAWKKSVRSGLPCPPWPWADTHPVARLRIPRLAYDEIVLEGATARTLAFGPVRLLTGAALGEEGNVVLAGHRTSWFRKLEGIRNEDMLVLDWYDAKQHKLRQRTYTVTVLRVVEPEDLALLAPTSEDALTLITCYPFGSSPRSPQRFVVRAVPAAALWN